MEVGLAREYLIGRPQKDLDFGSAVESYRWMGAVRRAGSEICKVDWIQSQDAFVKETKKMVTHFRGRERLQGPRTFWTGIWSWVRSESILV